MSVLIKGLKMPRNCYDCGVSFCAGGDLFWCGLAETEVSIDTDERDPDCPLVPVPPHGRLIDADALLKGCERVATEYATREFAFSQTAIETAPTIIEAEEGE